MKPAFAPWDFHRGTADIVARIKAKAQQGPDAWARFVGSREDMAGVTEDRQVTPGVYVLYRGFSVLSASATQGELEHRWLVVLSVGDPGGQRDPARRDAQAGLLLPRLLADLHGLVLDGCTGPLLPFTPPPPEPSKSGVFGYYPLAFKATTIYSTRSGPATGPLPLDRRAS